MKRLTADYLLGRRYAVARWERRGGWEVRSNDDVTVVAFDPARGFKLQFDADGSSGWLATGELARLFNSGRMVDR